MVFVRSFLPEVSAMSRPCPGPLAPTPPRTDPPPGACDSHIHVIGPHDRYPLNPDCSYVAPEAPVEKLVAFLAAMKIDRAVIAHVTAHGTDMAVTLDALKILGERGRGVAMVASDIDDAELDRLHDGGIRAVRLTPLFGDAVTLDALGDMSRRIARLGWHMVYAPPSEQAWIEAAPKLAELPTPVVVDHMAWRGWDVARGVDQPGLIAVLDALSAGNCWIKLAAPHRYSRTAPPWPDLNPFVRAMVDAAPNRIIWGSDWPHVRVWDGAMPRDADQFDWLADCGIDAATRRLILVDNPAELYGFR
jgi:predicted TIM-barrel fold metal-dependent hydrolase